MVVTFDGPNLVVILESAVTEVDVRVDLYLEWKTWVKLSDNAKFPQLFRVIGGDPLGNDLFAGSYFFVQNQIDPDPGIGGWRIRPPEEDIIITLNGNLFPEDSTTVLFVPTIGNFNTLLRLNTSSLTQLASTGLTVAENVQLTELHTLAGLDSSNPLIVTDSQRTAGITITQSIVEDPPGTIEVTRI